MPSTPADPGPNEPAPGSPATRRPARFRVLVVDDEKNIRTTLGVCLEQMGCSVTPAATADAALAAVERGAFDLAFLDLRLGESRGIDLLPRLLAARPGLAVVIMTAYATFDTAVEAVKNGAVDYLPKPFTPAQIRHVVDEVASRGAIARRVAELEAKLALEVPEADLSTDTPAMRAVLELLARSAASDAPLLLRGESGTGKGVLARALHAQSPRAARPFVTVNCPTLSGELLASELFGHARGAFTGAVHDQPGRVETAEGGTLFLDEIGELTPALQAKLLRFLQDKQFERIGENRTRRADVRVVAATNRDIETDVREGRFREDLLFRLNVIELRIPPLRERREDIMRMARAFLDFFARAAGRRAPEMPPAVEAALLAYPWPGNVRELRNAMERSVILWPGQVLALESLPERIGAGARAGAVPGLAGELHRATANGGAVPLPGADVTLEDLEREHIARVVARAPTLEDAARILGIDVSTLWRKRKKSGGRE